jgi:hypothetical protein
MSFHREVESLYLAGQELEPSAASASVNRHVAQALRKERLDKSMPTVAQRLKNAGPGLERIAVQIAQEIGRWVKDGPDLLVWTEAPLDHGPGIRAVELSDIVLVRTRPDVIGLRLTNGRARVVVRDYKVRSQVVDPAFDNGILVRALWAMSELQNPRCRWFVADREMEIDRDVIELETVNLLFSTTEDFIVRRQVSAAQLAEERGRMIELALVMADTEICEESQVAASPGFLCKDWCPYLHRCTAGQAHVRKYQGEEALSERLSQI